MWSPGFDAQHCLRTWLSVLVISAGDVEAGQPEVQDRPWLYIKLESSLGHMRPCLKKQKPVSTPLPNQTCLFSRWEDTGTRNEVVSCQRTHWKTLRGRMRSSSAGAWQRPSFRVTHPPSQQELCSQLSDSSGEASFIILIFVYLNSRGGESSCLWEFLYFREIFLSLPSHPILPVQEHNIKHHTVFQGWAGSWSASSWVDSLKER